MKKDPKIFLQHILECICEIENYTKRMTKPKFLKNKMAQDAVIRRLEIIGEAVKNLSADFKKKHPELHWRKIGGMRDILIHEYFGIDLNIVWMTVAKDVPKLKREISEFLKDY